MSMPTELLDEIARHALWMPPPSRPRSVRPSDMDPQRNWVAIAGLACASRRLRSIALRAWFQTLIIRKKGDWRKIGSIQGGMLFEWVRELRCHRTSLGPSSQKVLPRFKRLKSVWMSVQEYVCTPDEMPSCFPLMVSALPRSIERLELVALHRLDDDLLDRVAEFTSLQYLRLDPSTMGCSCGRTEDMPIGTRFQNGSELATHFAAHLAPLTALRTLSLDLWMTPATARHNHEYNLFVSSCDSCSYRHLDNTRNNEQSGAEVMSRTFTNLTSLSWMSCFSEGREMMVHFDVERKGADVTCKRRTKPSKKIAKSPLEADHDDSGDMDMPTEDGIESENTEVA